MYLHVFFLCLIGIEGVVGYEPFWERHGEGREEFINCVATCSKTMSNCSDNEGEWLWQLLLPSCGERCEHQCRVSLEFDPPVQYNGKWPFQKVWTTHYHLLLLLFFVTFPSSYSLQILGMQEFLSAIASLGNLLVFVYHSRKFSAEVQETYAIKIYFNFFSCVG